MRREDGNQIQQGTMVPTAARRFRVAWIFFLGTAGLGILLRLLQLHPLPGWNYNHLLHTHSHLAFLGWVCNGCFALSLRFFIPEERAPAYAGIWWTLQIAVLGMLASFPWQGYGPVSIAFLTLHLVASTAFAWRLGQERQVAAAARWHLRAALAFMVGSNVGPLLLGPLAAAGLREAPAYQLAIYGYLHFQYNGWFLFFLQAVYLARLQRRGGDAGEKIACRAGWWLVAGCLGTVLLSALWLHPPAWVRVLAGLAGVAQLWGLGLMLWGLPGVATLWPENTARAVSLRWLARVAAGAWVAKHVLQLLAVWPALGVFMHERSAVIGFLHLVFLGVVTPAMLVWAIDAGWLRSSGRVWAGVCVYLVGALLTGAWLAYPALAQASGVPLSPAVPIFLAGAAVLLAVGIGLLLFGLLRPPRETPGAGAGPRRAEPR